MGKFIGNVDCRWLQEEGDDRSVMLLADFKYIDNYGVEWLAPSGSIVNGASIPKVLWGLLGAPMEGDYRRASVIHDVFCNSKERPHVLVHECFAEMLRSLGVRGIKGSLMATGVKTFGPKWD
jgi:hypothetical protein